MPKTDTPFLMVLGLLLNPNAIVMPYFIEKLRKINRMVNQPPVYKGSYAFIGMGSHALANLYPVINYLGIDLKYIVTRSTSGARNAQQKYPNTNCITNIQQVINDDDITGCFVCTQPSAHFGIIQSLVSSGKHVFVEKPPCFNSIQLNELTSLSILHNKKIVIGLQKCYAPSIKILKRKLDNVDYYSLKYQTGPYPEGDPVAELFIHPISLAVFLFGPAKILSLQKLKSKNGLIILLHTQHEDNTVGSLELANSLSWREACESLSVYTKKGWYDWKNSQTLTFTSTTKSILNIPVEKVKPFPYQQEFLYQVNSFNPTLSNNPVYYGGFFDEVRNFIHLNEGHKCHISSFIEDLKPTYDLLDQINK